MATKGSKVVTIPLAPRTARAIDLAVGERADGPTFLAADGCRRELAQVELSRSAGRYPGVPAGHKA